MLRPTFVAYQLASFRNSSSRSIIGFLRRSSWKLSNCYWRRAGCLQKGAADNPNHPDLFLIAHNISILRSSSRRRDGSLLRKGLRGPQQERSANIVQLEDRSSLSDNRLPHQPVHRLPTPECMDTGPSQGRLAMRGPQRNQPRPVRRQHE
jgi:hypothetical protein